MSRKFNPAYIPGDRLRDNIAKAGRDFRALQTSDPEEYERIVAEGRAKAEKYYRMARGIK